MPQRFRPAFSVLGPDSPRLPVAPSQQLIGLAQAQLSAPLKGLSPAYALNRPVLG